MYENQIYAAERGKKEMKMVSCEIDEKGMSWTKRFVERRIKELMDKIEALEVKREQYESDLSELHSCSSEIARFEQLALPIDKAS